jgi:hypothetical protein
MKRLRRLLSRWVNWTLGFIFNLPGWPILWGYLLWEKFHPLPPEVLEWGKETEEIARKWQEEHPYYCGCNN